MGSIFIGILISVWTLFELFITQKLIHSFALILLFILSLVQSLIYLELDILSAALLNAIAVATIVLTLVLLHLGWGAKVAYTKISEKYLIIVSYIVIILTTTNFFFSANYSETQFLITYQDLNLTIGNREASNLTLLHEFFYNIFIYETWIINLLIGIGLVLLIAFLKKTMPNLISNQSNLKIAQIRGTTKLRRQSRRHLGASWWNQMLMRGSQLHAMDGSGVGRVRAFHLYEGSWRRRLSDGGILKGAITHISYIVRRSRGSSLKKIRRLRIGHKTRMFVTQIRFSSKRVDLTRSWCLQNGGVLLKRRGLFWARNVHGPILKSTRRWKHKFLFKDTI